MAELDKTPMSTKAKSGQRFVVSITLDNAEKREKKNTLPLLGKVVPTLFLR